MSSSNWVKNMYFYLVMVISLFFFVLGTFSLLRTAYIYNFSPALLKQEVQTSWFNFSSEDKCRETTKSKPSNPNEFETIPVNKADCDKQLEENKKLWLESNLLWSILAVVLSSLVMGSHYVLMGRSVIEKPSTPTKPTNSKK